MHADMNLLHIQGFVLRHEDSFYWFLHVAGSESAGRCVQQATIRCSLYKPAEKRQAHWRWTAPRASWCQDFPSLQVPVLQTWGALPAALIQPIFGYNLPISYLESQSVQWLSLVFLAPISTLQTDCTYKNICNFTSVVGNPVTAKWVSVIRRISWTK